MAKRPAVVTVVQQEPKEARDERARQIAQLRAFMREGARGVALQNIPHTPQAQQEDADAAKVGEIKRRIGPDIASHNPASVRKAAAEMRARQQAAAEARAAKAGTEEEEEEPAKGEEELRAAPSGKAAQERAEYLRRRQTQGMPGGKETDEALREFGGEAP